MISNSGRRGVVFACITFGVIVLFLVGLRPLMPIDETRYLSVAWEMWQGGSKFVPHLNGEIYTHKPPLLFWLMNVVWMFTGVSEIAARLIGPAFGLLSVLLTAVLARRLWPETPERAGFAALILATGGVFLLFGSATMFDTMLAAATLIAMIALWVLSRGGDWRMVVLLGLALAFGVFAKGPVVLIHVMPVALLMPIWADRNGRLPLPVWYRQIGVAVLVALALVAVWLGPALIFGGAEYRHDVLWRQSAARVGSDLGHSRPWWMFLALLPIYFWPWGWGLNALYTLTPRAIRADGSARMVAIWAGTALVLFSLIGGKQTHYLLPELPALALLLSGMILPDRLRLWQRLGLLLPAAAVVILALALALGLVPKAVDQGIEVPSLVFLAVLALFAGVAVALLLIRSIRAVVAIAAPATLILLHLTLMPALFSGYNPASIGQTMAAHQAQGLAITDADYHGQFTFAGRLTQAVSLLNNVAGLSSWAQAHPGGLILSQEEQTDAMLEQVGMQRFNGREYRLYRVGKAAE